MTKGGLEPFGGRSRLDRRNRRNRCRRSSGSGLLRSLHRDTTRSIATLRWGMEEGSRVTTGMTPAKEETCLELLKRAKTPIE